MGKFSISRKVWYFSKSRVTLPLPTPPSPLLVLYISKGGPSMKKFSSSQIDTASLLCRNFKWRRRASIKRAGHYFNSCCSDKTLLALNVNLEWTCKGNVSHVVWVTLCESCCCVYVKFQQFLFWQFTSEVCTPTFAEIKVCTSTHTRTHIFARWERWAKVCLPKISGRAVFVIWFRAGPAS